MAIDDPFANSAEGINFPADDAATVSPSDSADLATATRAVYVGTGGDLTVIMLKGETVTFANVPDGSLLPIRVARVKDTGTDADDILALF